MRAITHIHTDRSWDSRLSIETLVTKLVDLDVSMAMVSDHDTFEGAIELKRRVRSIGLPVTVPIAAEVRTDLGDVVAVFEDESDLPPVGRLASARDVAAIVADHGGLVWLPHPYRGHPDPWPLAEVSDVIEVFNSRCSAKKNARGAEMCEQIGATPAFGADVHLSRELGAVVVEYPLAGTIIDTLRAEPRPLVTRRALKSDVMAAEIINGVKSRRPMLVGYFGLRYVRHRAREIARGHDRG